MKRFLDKVKKEKDCWLWIGGKSSRGYGMFWYQNKLQGAHRVSYMLFKGKIPKKLVIDHICKNPLCVNPDHLRAMTIYENAFRDIPKQTHCKNGHLLNKENVYLENRGSYKVRKCMTCRRKWVRNNRLARNP
jgi:hypothetical protein